MKKTVEKAIKIENGRHTGVIKEIIYKDKPYEYVDIVIEEDEYKFPLKCGVPFTISENTALGKVLKAFGAVVVEGKEIEVDDFIKEGLKVEFITMEEETKKGTFIKIQPMSVKPL